MNQKTQNLIKFAGDNYHFTLINLLSHYPSLDPSFAPVEDLILAITQMSNTGHKIEMRGFLSAQIYELAGTDLGSAIKLVEGIKDEDLQLQLNAVLHVAMLRNSRMAA